MGQRQEGRVPTHTVENSPNRQDRRVSPRLGRQATYRQGRQAAGIGTDAGYDSQGHLEAAGKGSGTPRSVQAAPKSQCHSPLGIRQHLEVGTTQRKATWQANLGTLRSDPLRSCMMRQSMCNATPKSITCQTPQQNLPSKPATPRRRPGNAGSWFFPVTYGMIIRTY